MAALVLAGWATTCFVDVAVPGFAAAAAFAPLLTVVAVPVMALGVSSRHLVPAGIAAIAAAVPWALVAGYASAGPGPTSARDGLTVTVMSVDAAGGQADAAAISRLARAYGPDVVVVSGLTSRFAHDLTVTGLNAAVTTRAVQISDGRTDGIGLWSRSPVSDVQPLPGLSRPAVRGVLRPGNAAPIGIVAAQASGTALAPDPGWSRELAELEDAGPDTEQQLIVGVKGAPWQPGFRQLTSGDWQDAADVAGHGLRPTWPSWSPMPVVPLDHVIVSGGLGVSAVDTAQIPGTAHRALIVSLVAQQAG